MTTLLMLAQSAKDASDTVGILERILNGGVPLICLCLAALFGAGFWWAIKRNHKMTEEALKKAEAREEAAKEIAEKHKTEQEALLREMLDRDREAQEAQAATTAAVEGFTRALQDNTRVQADILERVKNIERGTL